jgi:hypothetical protein
VFEERSRWPLSARKPCSLSRICQLAKGFQWSYTAANQNTIEARTAGLPPITSLTAVSTVSAGAVLDGVVVRPNALMIVSSSIAT